MIRWWILYSNNQVLGGTDRVEWAAARSDGVVAVVSRIGLDAYGRILGRFATGGDWYWWTDSGVWAGASSPTDGVWIPYDGPVDGEVDAKQGALVNNTKYLQTVDSLRVVIANP